MTELHPDRYFDSDPTVRRHASALYDETRELPIVSPHGHVDAAILASDEPFPDPAALLITPDHYILRVLYGQGVPLEALGVPPIDGKPPAAETDPRKIWQTFADNLHSLRGTPTRAWLDYELQAVLGVRRELNSSSAQHVYDMIAEKLQAPEFRPRALFRRFNIEVLATTDAATDWLAHHRKLKGADLGGGRVIPTFRPDALFRIASPTWRNELTRLEQLSGGGGSAIDSFTRFIAAIRKRRGDFKALGATATDHDVMVARTERLDDSEAERLFSKAITGTANTADQDCLLAHLLMEMARLSIDDGLVMQMHVGSHRYHNKPLYERFGPDRGDDLPVAAEFTHNLRAMLNAYGNDLRFRLIVFTLDESTYSRELAPLASHYPALLLGAPWWFHDSIEGMTRFRQQTMEIAGIDNTAGFNDDTRAFLSIPARHDLSRRVDANYLAGLVARHVIDIADAREMAKMLAYSLAKRAYRLDVAAAHLT